MDTRSQGRFPEGIRLNLDTQEIAIYGHENKVKYLISNKRVEWAYTSYLQPIPRYSP